MSGSRYRSNTFGGPLNPMRLYCPESTTPEQQSPEARNSICKQMKPAIRVIIFKSSTLYLWLTYLTILQYLVASSLGPNGAPTTYTEQKDLQSIPVQTRPGRLV